MLDALIIGGGPAGSTAAILLAQAGWNVAVVEKSTFPRRKVCGEFLSATNLPLLKKLGVDCAFHDLAGPPIDRVGLLAQDSWIEARMPSPSGVTTGWGRALSRHHLDTLLLQRAAESGAKMYQPWSVSDWRDTGSVFQVQLISKANHTSRTVTARLLIAAHGSWDLGHLPSQPPRPAMRSSDLLAFKTHLRDSGLPSGIMPLAVFPGGYAGTVRCEQERTSFSFCVRRDVLERCRAETPQMPAAQAVLRHIQKFCSPVRDILEPAVAIDPWLAAGPVRPGVKKQRLNRVFLTGNAAGEAHPTIAEGISMALQSSCLLARVLLAHPDALTSDSAMRQAQRAYRSAWQRGFIPRICIATIIAHWAMQPLAVAGLRPCLTALPRLLTWCARASGKASPLVRVQA